MSEKVGLRKGGMDRRTIRDEKEEGIVHRRGEAEGKEERRSKGEG